MDKMVLATNLGFPRIGAQRELKKAVEGYWAGKFPAEFLLQAGKELRERHWRLQKDAGLDHIPSNDFSFYDQMLDMSVLLGAVPERYNWKGGDVDLDTYFAMARGRQQNGVDVTAMTMTKWLDTNYHYLVPELTKDMKFKIGSSKVFDEYTEARNLGIQTRPVLVGPLTYLLEREQGGRFHRLPLHARARHRESLHPHPEKACRMLGAEWVQIDEPALALDLEDRYKDAYQNGL
jgi:5-methyltetrahydropteroyltriglutamate--homocysteine methyltransferase